MKRLILIAAIISLFGPPAFASGDLPTIRSSSFVGKHFLIAFMQNEIEILDPRVGINLEMFITATYNAKVTIKIPGLPPQYHELGIEDVLRVRVPDSLEIREQEYAVSKSIEVTSDYPISIYCFSSQYQTSDAFTAIPVSNWGNEYVVISMPNDQYEHTTGRDSLFSVTPRRSEFLIIAGFDSTEVDFIPTSVTARGKQAGSNHRVILNKGQCYLVQSLPAGLGFGDLTGTIVRSSKPVGVISGHVRTAVPQFFPHPDDTKDHLCEMLPPTKSWGRYFLTIPFDIIDAPKGDLFKLVNIHSGTEITLQTSAENKEKHFFGMPGSSISLYVTEPAIWKSNQPVLLAQFMTHKRPYDSKKYDPALVVIPPVEQFVQRIVFSTPGNIVRPDQFDSHSAMVIAHRDALHNLKYDGRKVITFTNIANQTIPETEYHYASFKIFEGRHTLSCDSGAFAGIIYGQGSADSYAMILGSSLTNPYRNDTIPPYVVADIDCGKLDGYVIDVLDSNTTGINYVWVVEDSTNNFRWHVDPIYDTSNYVKFYAEPIDIYQDGRFMMDLYDKNGNGRRYVYIYNGIKLEFPKELRFENIMWDETSCLTFKLANRGNGNVKIKSLFYNGDNRVVFRPDTIYPYTMKPKDSVMYRFCYEPNGDSTSFYGEIEIDVECDKTKHIVRVIGTLKAPMLETRGWEFGKVRVGDTVCNWITFVNKGNIPIRIDSLRYTTASDRFFPDTLGKFPFYVPAQDSVKIRICFSPDSVGFFDLIAKAANEIGLDNVIVFEGQGIAPSVESVFVDWGRRRVGTSNDTTVYLKNSGEAVVKLLFDSFLEASIYDRTTDALSKINATLAQNETLQLNLNYSPANTDSYRIKALINTDWRYHPELVLETIGLGTLPEITVFDFDFDSIMVFDRKTEMVKLALVGGNEDLTIDEVFVDSGDDDAFEIDFNALKDLMLSPESVLYSPITFAPTRRGQHELILSVRHDAEPNYQRSIAKIKLKGFAKDLGVSTKLEGALSKIACVRDTAVFSIENTGNFPVVLTSAEIEPAPFSHRWIVSPNAPEIYMPGEKRDFPIEVFPMRGESGTLKVNAVFNDTLAITSSLPVQPVVLSLSVNDVDGLEFGLGDTVSITFGGTIPARVTPKIDFVISINVARNVLFLREQSAELILRQGAQTSRIPVALTQSGNEIIIKALQDSLELISSAEWSVQLEFLVLLSDVLEQKIKVSAISNLCFNPAEQEIFTKIKNICIFNLRSVKLITNLPKLKVTPNPIRENLNVEIYMPEDGYVDLSAIDGLGKNISLKSNLYLKKGSHSLIFEISEMTSGKYMLVLSTPNLIRKTMFIITK